jgi:poly-gamma-glutamate synthesis protein (capsule biosynthesis protein)
VASTSAGVPHDWGATSVRPGVHLLPNLSESSVSGLAELIERHKQARDVVIVSIHWGSNWGYVITDEQRHFAHGLIERAGVSIVHGHSSHHPRGIEIHAGRLVLYGCGDFINDYEGIGGYEEFRGDLTAMYFADVDPATGKLVDLHVTPLQIRGFSLNPPLSADIDWLAHTLDRESGKLGTRITRMDGALRLRPRGITGDASPRL